MIDPACESESILFFPPDQKMLSFGIADWEQDHYFFRGKTLYLTINTNTKELKSLPDSSLAEINSLLEELGYPKLKDYNSIISPKKCIDWDDIQGEKELFSLIYDSNFLENTKEENLRKIFSDYTQIILKFEFSINDSKFYISLCLRNINKNMNTFPEREIPSIDGGKLTELNESKRKKIIEDYQSLVSNQLMNNYNNYIDSQLSKINRFSEMCSDPNISERDITKYLAQKENQFILTIKFGAKEVHSELNCQWQTEEQKENIRPDFFVVQSDGYADIVEFKRPNIGKSVVVGSENRETFSATLHSYIAQTRGYKKYFRNENNQKWFEEKYGFKVNNPRRYLIVGRRSDFASDVWREIIEDYKDITIITFDDLIEGAKAQFPQK